VLSGGGGGGSRESHDKIGYTPTKIFQQPDKAATDGGRWPPAAEALGEAAIR